MKSENIKGNVEDKCENFINITPAAVDFIKTSVRQHKKCLGIRLSIKSGGCSGMSYEVDFVENPNSADIVVEKDGVRVYIAPKSALFVANMTMDYVTTPIGGSLVFENPNAKAKCSCGKSFSVDGSGAACNSSECCGR